jgi:hypothetical protein
MLTCALIIILSGPTGLASDESGESTEREKAWWKTAREMIERVTHDQGRTVLDIESPKWFEAKYHTIGRMPLIDTCLRKPLVMPEVAIWADERAQASDGGMSELFELAHHLSCEIAAPSPSFETPDRAPDWLVSLDHEFTNLPFDEEIRNAIYNTVEALFHGQSCRNRAFGALSHEEREKVMELLPGYFVNQTPTGEVVRGYTTDTSDHVELIDLLQKVNFDEMLGAAGLIAEAADGLRMAFDSISLADEDGISREIVYERETPIGRILIGGTENNVYTEEYVLLIDLGGDDLYLNHPAATSLDGPGAAIHADISGNDTYRSGHFSQGSAIAGVTAFLDFDGNDTYRAGHYSQGAALCGFSFFCDGGGDDTYNGDLGVQCFSIFGYSIFAELSGRDTYRCNAMGQGCASTLGVSVLVEAQGDDLYRAGGRYGFYSNYDSSCAQGAASGMRPWPPNDKITVYGGIGFLSEGAGNDCYHAYIIGQGGSYIFSLGMLVDSEGNDTYDCERYCRGVGVHLSAAVAVDRAGDDVQNGSYGNTGYSLDRSSGVFVDFDGNDTYRTSGGIGFGHKPRGCGIFVDISGNDTYAGWENNYGKADWPFGDDQFSTGFFLDLHGSDLYPGEKYRNNGVWEEGAFGYGEDTVMETPHGDIPAWWSPEPTGAGMSADFGEREKTTDGELQNIIGLLASSSPLIRLTAMDRNKSSTGTLLDAVSCIAQKGGRAQRKHCIDVIQVMGIRGEIDAVRCRKIAPLLACEDYDMRLLALNALRQQKVGDPLLLQPVAKLALEDPSEEVRSMACLTLGVSGWSGALKSLTGALNDPHWMVRRRAAIGLADLAHQDSHDDLLSILKEDPSFQVRAYAAKALGKLGRSETIPALENALDDDSAFVRCLVARTLLLDYSRAGAMEVLIDLIDWPNRPLRNRWVMEFLTDYTAQSIPHRKDDWRTWWREAGDDFDPAVHREMYDQLAEARKLERSGEKRNAAEAYRKIYCRHPDHQAVANNLSDLLNSIAWELAVSGTELPRGLELARESVSIRSNPMNIDTLAVLYYLNDERDKAVKTLEDAAVDAEESEKEQFLKRLEEFRTGELVL